MKNNSRVLIAGAGEAGSMLLAEYARHGRESAVIGFLDDDPAKRGGSVGGKPVIGGTDAIGRVIAEYRITHVVIAMPSAAVPVVSRVVADALAVAPGTVMHIMPRAERFFDTVPVSPSLQDFPFAELIGRTEFTLNIDLIREHFAGKTLLVTGAGGSIGSEICRQLLKFDVRKIVALGRGEHSLYTLAKSLQEYLALMARRPEVVYRVADVRDRALVARIFSEHRPQIVFHAAAHKHVPLMEANEVEALRNNVQGTATVLDVAAAAGVENFVLVSTDKAVRPTNVMGVTKRLAELVAGHYHREHGLRTAIVRFGNVIGSRGSVIPLFREQIERGLPVTVTHPEVTRYFMSIPEASLLVINAAALAGGGETFVLDMGEQYKVADVARRLIELYGYEPGKDIPIVFTGLRPGEKLYEELFYDYGELERTGNDTIYILNNDPVRLGSDQVAFLAGGDYAALHAKSPREIREYLRGLVPEYTFDETSDFAHLDNRMVN